jgi:hypothetical protein
MRRCEVPVTTFHRDDETISIEPPPSVYHVSDSCNVFASPINQGVYPAQAEHLQPTAADWGGGFRIELYSSDYLTGYNHPSVIL